MSRRILAVVFLGEFNKMPKIKTSNNFGLAEDRIGNIKWDRTESPAVAILDEECKNSRPLIRECIGKRIREYPF